MKNMNKFFGIVKNRFEHLINDFIGNIIEQGKYAGLPRYGLNQDNTYNFKRLQALSSTCLMGFITNNKRYLLDSKKILFSALKHQRDDGYFYTDKYSKTQDFARANVQFLCIEFFNGYKYIEKFFNEEEKNEFKSYMLKSANYVRTYISALSEINQVVGAALLFKFCSHYFNRYEEDYQILKEQILLQQKDDGSWVEKHEAPGVDLLYLSLQLAYHSRLCDLDHDPRLLQSLSRGVSFINNFLVSNGDLDVSVSKRWLPMTPQGKRFLIYALTKFTSKKHIAYIKKCFLNSQIEDIFYCLKSIPQYHAPSFWSNPFKIKNLEVLSKNYSIIQKGDLRISFVHGPLRISGGEISSIYSDKKHWVLQQAPIDKYSLPANASQLRIQLRDGRILNSSLDCYAYFDPQNLKSMGVFRYEDSKFIVTPFGYYKASEATSKIGFIRKYKIVKDKILVEDTIIIGEDSQVDEINALVPLLNGKINSEMPVHAAELEGIYGKTKLHKIKYIKDKFIPKGGIIKRNFAIKLN